MKNEEKTEIKDISRRNFLKKLAAGAVFTVPTIQSFSLLDAQYNQGKNWWTGHGHGNRSTPPPPTG